MVKLKCMPQMHLFDVLGGWRGLARNGGKLCSNSILWRYIRYLRHRVDPVMVCRYCHADVAISGPSQSLGQPTFSERTTSECI
jgi:hypothetical protein